MEMMNKDSLDPYYKNRSNDEALSVKDKEYLLLFAVFWITAVILFKRFQYRAGIVVSALMLLIYIMLPRRYKFLFIVSQLPFQAIAKISPTVPSTVIVLYALFVLEHIRNCGLRINKRILVGGLLLAVHGAIALISYNLPVAKYVAGLLNIVFAAVVMVSFYDKETYGNHYFYLVGWVFTISMIIDVIAPWVFPRLPYYILPEKQLLLDRIGRFCALNGDPNYYSQLILIALGFLVAIIYNDFSNHKIIQTFIEICLFVFLLIAGIQSLSKGYAISLAVTLIIAVYFLLVEGKRGRKRVLFTIIYLLISLPIAYLIINGIVLPIIEKRSETDLFTGRLNIWENYLSAFWHNPLFIVIGTGFSNGENVIQTVGHKLASHNFYLEALGDLGLVGIGIVLYLWHPALQKVKEVLFSVKGMFLCAFLISSLSLSLSSSDVIYLLLPTVELTHIKESRANLRMRN